MNLPYLTVTFLHACACLALLVKAGLWITSHPQGADATRALRGFVITATALGFVVVFQGLAMSGAQMLEGLTNGNPQLMIVTIIPIGLAIMRLLTAPALFRGLAGKALPIALFAAGAALPEIANLITVISRM